MITGKIGRATSELQSLRENFRIYNPNISGKRAYLDLNGNIPNNKLLENGKEAGRSQGEYNAVTHFNIKRNK